MKKLLIILIGLSSMLAMGQAGEAFDVFRINPRASAPTNVFWTDGSLYRGNDGIIYHKVSGSWVPLVAYKTGAELEAGLDAELANTRWKEIEVPAGGTSGQVLKKDTGTDYDYSWQNDDGGGGGVSDHGALTGLADDDHTQYHNDARAAAWLSALYANLDTDSTDDFDGAFGSLSGVPAGLSDGDDVGITELADDATPDLAGNLNANDNDILDLNLLQITNTSGSNTVTMNFNADADSAWRIAPLGGPALQYSFVSGGWTFPILDTAGHFSTDNVEAALAELASGTASEESIQDIIGGMLVGTETLINVGYDDANDWLDFEVENNINAYDNSIAKFIRGTEATRTNVIEVSRIYGQTLADFNTDGAPPSDEFVIITDAPPALTETENHTASGDFVFTGAHTIPSQTLLAKDAGGNYAVLRFKINGVERQLKGDGSSIYYGADGIEERLLNETDRAELEERSFVLPLGAVGADIETGTFVNFVPVHDAITITRVEAHLNTAPTGSAAIFDVNVNGSTRLSTKLSIDATENYSDDAASQAVISSGAVTAKSTISVDVDQKGSTVAGANGTVTIYYVKS